MHVLLVCTLNDISSLKKEDFSTFSSKSIFVSFYLRYYYWLCYADTFEHTLRIIKCHFSVENEKTLIISGEKSCLECKMFSCWRCVYVNVASFRLLKQWKSIIKYREALRGKAHIFRMSWIQSAKAYYANKYLRCYHFCFIAYDMYAVRYTYSTYYEY